MLRPRICLIKMSLSRREQEVGNLVTVTPRVAGFWIHGHSTFDINKERREYFTITLMEPEAMKPQLIYIHGTPPTAGP